MSPLMSAPSKTTSVQLRHIFIQAKHWACFSLASTPWDGVFIFFFLPSLTCCSTCLSPLLLLLLLPSILCWKWLWGRLALTLSLKTCIFWEGCGNVCCFHDFLGGWLDRWPWGTSSEKIPLGSMVSTILHGLSDSLLYLLCLKTPESKT